MIHLFYTRPGNSCVSQGEERLFFLSKCELDCDMIHRTHQKAALFFKNERISLFQGCFEKVEEWLDDNKFLLGTIGMVIVVVQVET